MSTYLWKYYFEDDVDNFRQLLANANYHASAHAKPHNTTIGGNSGTAIGSPGKGLGTSPTWSGKARKTSKGHPATNAVGPKPHRVSGNVTLTRADINARDSFGVTLLHYISSSAGENAPSYALAFLELPLLDLYVQDLESGWTALHRALYFGNVTIARALMDRDFRDAVEHSNTGSGHNAGGLIKIKDREGNSPFDVFGATITNRILRHGLDDLTLSYNAEDGEDEMAHGDSGDSNGDGFGSRMITPHTCIDGDELFTFGSNKNITLGFGDEDDRQYPERIVLKRPEHLLRRFQTEHDVRAPLRVTSGLSPSPHEADINRPRDLSALVRFRSIIIQDVQLSKLHTTVLTTDPEANLYVCGFGPGGRLGTGDETTRFNFVCVYGGGLQGKKIIQVGLGQNHTLAISSEGEIFTWGSNAFGQLGYSVPSSNVKDEEPIQLLPRQIFGPLKREVIIGAAASRTHSVVHTNASLYTFGKNDGQLGLVDSDARSLEFQVIPRKVAASLFSAPITMVSAIDRATICLLDNHDVWIFANYGHTKMSFPLEGFSNYFLKNSYPTTRYDNAPNHITKITSGGDTICAMTRMGDVFTITVNQIQKTETGSATASTTNPAKIRGAVSSPQRVWSLRKGHMAVRDVDVGQDGSIIICTESGSVWRRVKRPKIKDANAPLGITEYKPKDYKFSRVPGLTRITAVRSNIFGAYAAVRRDCDVLKNQVEVASNTLWSDLFPLLPFHKLAREDDSDTEEPAPRLWTPRRAAHDSATIRHAVLTSTNIETDLRTLVAGLDPEATSAYDLMIGTTISDTRIPCHEFVLAGRTGIMQNALARFRQSYFFSIPEILTIEYDKEGNTLILFQAVDFITVLNLILYVYTDTLVDVWHHTRHAPQMTLRYRQVRTELMRIASHLELRSLESAVRLMTEPPKTLHQDLETAILKDDYFETADVDVEINGSTVKVHSALMCQRCPFFEGLFNGRAAGLWLSSRRELLRESQEAINVDLKHVDYDVFRLVLRHIYADTGEELFDDVVTADSDAFLDFIMEVMSVANELMLDRLAQLCQKLLGRFVTTRNVCSLLNAVAPCSVSEFKDAAFEYICLNLEGMLENHLLNELDDDLILELDQVVRQNQLACLPIAKSGRAEAELLERHPELADLIDRSKRAKVDSMALQSRLHEDETRFANFRARAGLAEDTKSSSAVQTPRRSSSKEGHLNVRSPTLRSKASANDLMFNMDDDIEEDSASGVLPTAHPRKSTGKERVTENPYQARTILSSLPKDDMWFDARGKALSPVSAEMTAASLTGAEFSSPTYHSLQREQITGTSQGKDALKNKQPWATTATISTKLDMKEIMEQTSMNRKSNISSALDLRAGNVDNNAASVGGRMSQRERKKYIQQQQLQSTVASATPTTPLQTPQQDKSASAWQTASTGPKISLKDVLGGEGKKSAGSSPSIARTSSIPPLTLRQTVPGNQASTRKSSTVQVPPKQQPQQRSVSTPSAIASINSPASTATTTTRPFPQSRQSQPLQIASSSPSPVIKSIRHQRPSVEPSLQLSMADILSQQQTEKDIVKEAAAKRSLQEIQEEQAFQEWWEQESRKVREEEEAATAAAARLSSGSRGGRGRGKGRGGGGDGVITRGRGIARGRGRGRAGHRRGSSPPTSSSPSPRRVDASRAQPEVEVEVEVEGGMRKYSVPGGDEAK